MEFREFQRLLWISGLPGSGTTALRSLFDGHSQVLSYPFDLSGFLRFYNSGLYPLKRYTWEKGIRVSLPWVLEDETFSSYDRLSSKDSLFCVDGFIHQVQNYLPNDAPFSLTSFFEALAFALKKQWRYYEEKKPKYFCILATTPDLPEEKELLENEYFLIPERSWNIIYESHKNFFLVKEKWGYAKFFLLKANRYRAYLEKGHTYFTRHPNLNTFSFSFESFRSTQEATLKRICEWLQIPFEKSLLELTLLERKDVGVSTSFLPKKAQVATRSTPHFLATTDFEERFQRKAITSQKTSVIQVISDCFRAARVLPLLQLTNQIAIVSSYGSFKDRYAFLKFCEEKGLSQAELSALSAKYELPKVKQFYLRTQVFWAYCLSSLSYSFLPSPKSYGFVFNFLLRSRTYFWVRAMHLLLRRKNGHKTTLDFGGLFFPFKKRSKLLR